VADPVDDHMAEVHRVLEGALARIDSMCAELEIEYFLVGGTLLGARRHAGFIPWDDDVDIAMSRPDFERFTTEGRSHLPQGLVLHTRSEDPILGSDAKIYIDGTQAPSEFGEAHGLQKPLHDGLFLDVFPTYNISRNRWVAALERGCGWLVYVRPWARAMARSRHRVERHRWRWILAAAVPVRLAEAVKRWLLRRSRRRRPVTVGLGLGGLHGEAYPVEVVYPLRHMAFGGLTVPAPQDPDEFLRLTFGDDYMVPPPESQRQIHSRSITLDPALVSRRC
jgi:lipopolysaccharide cholinephosphotransferase